MGDVAMGLAGLSLLAAIAWPWMAHSAFLDRVEAVTDAVEDTRIAVLRFREEEDAWPPAAEPGRAPEALAPYLEGPTDFRSEIHLLEMARWEALEAPPSIPGLPTETTPEGRPRESIRAPAPEAVPLVGLRVHASEEALLAALLETYGPASSFVRDTTWTLIFPRRSRRP